MSGVWACPWCLEDVLPGERFTATMNGERFHQECMARQVIGPVAHLERRCSCYVLGSEVSDDPSLSKRDAAREAFRMFKATVNIHEDGAGSVT